MPAMMVNFKNEDIISEVERHPAIYDRFSIEYKNRTLKETSWWKVTENIVGKKDWAGKNYRHRNEARRFVQRRWKSLRDTFTRSLKNKPSGNGKRYVFEKQMSFLLPFLNENMNSYNANYHNADDYDENVHQEDSEDSLSQMETLKKINPEVIIKTEGTSDLDENSIERPVNAFLFNELNHQRKLSTEDHLDDPISEQPRTPMNDFDPEKLFLLSLLPSLKLLNPRDRLKARIKIMEALEPFVKDA